MDPSSSFSSSYVSVSFALWRETRVSDPVTAVVVDGVLASNPAQPPPLISIEVLELLLVPPPLTLGGTVLGFHRRLAAVDVEAPVGGHEGSLGPVGLFESSPSGPIICIPQTRVELHWLVEWESHSQVFAVLEHSDWDVVH